MAVGIAILNDTDLAELRDRIEVRFAEAAELADQIAAAGVRK
jgi:hypothetical protein